MNTKQLKLEFFYLRKVLFQYRAFLRYIYYRWIVAPRIMQIEKVLSRPITNTDFSLHILTSHRDMMMAAWALASWYAVSPVVGALYIHDDGTLTQSDHQILRRLFSDVQIVSTTDFSSRYADQLAAYPVLRDSRSTHSQFFSFKKIIDPFIVSNTAVRMIIDSDILWFSNPNDIATLIVQGAQSSLMQKNNEQLSIETTAGVQHSWYNAGIVVYGKQHFDAQALEQFFSTLSASNRKSLHFADQFGYSICLRNLTALPEDRYVIRAAVTDTVIARHYTSPRRPLFYIEGVKRLTHLLS